MALHPHVVFLICWIHIPLQFSQCLHLSTLNTFSHSSLPFSDFVIVSQKLCTHARTHTLVHVIKPKSEYNSHELPQCEHTVISITKENAHTIVKYKTISMSFQRNTVISLSINSPLPPNYPEWRSKKKAVQYNNKSENVNEKLWLSTSAASHIQYFNKTLQKSIKYKHWLRSDRNNCRESICPLSVYTIETWAFCEDDQKHLQV